MGPVITDRRVQLAVVASIVLVALAILYGIDTGLIEPDYVVDRPGSAGQSTGS